jgi:hypothetical protein
MRVPVRGNRTVICSRRGKAERECPERVPHDWPAGLVQRAEVAAASTPPRQRPEGLQRNPRNRPRNRRPSRAVRLRSALLIWLVREGKFLDYLSIRKHARRLVWDSDRGLRPFGSTTAMSKFLASRELDAPWVRMSFARYARLILSGNPRPLPDLAAPDAIEKWRAIYPGFVRPEKSDMALVERFLKIQTKLVPTFSDLAHREKVQRQAIEKSVRRTASQLMIPLREMPKTGRPSGVTEDFARRRESRSGPSA